MREFSQIEGCNINLLGQDIKDILIITRYFPIQTIVGIKQDKYHGHKEYTIRLADSGSMRDVLLEVTIDNVVIKDTMRVV